MRRGFTTLAAQAEMTRDRKIPSPATCSSFVAGAAI